MLQTKAFPAKASGKNIRRMVQAGVVRVKNAFKLLFRHNRNLRYSNIETKKIF